MKIDFKNLNTVNNNLFKKEILDLENHKLRREIYINTGSIPILISAPHVLKQKTIDKIKLEELFTKTIALYLNKHFNTHVFINHKNFEDDFNYLDPNSSKKHIYNYGLINYIKLNNIKLVIDLHGAKESRDFDIDIGTLDGKSSKKQTIELLKKSLNDANLFNIKENYIFHGGKISQVINEETNIEVLQLEINYKMRANLINLKKIIQGLSFFINNYLNKNEDFKKV